jgi:hypothetical protein
VYMKASARIGAGIYAPNGEIYSSAAVEM